MKPKLNKWSLARAKRSCFGYADVEYARAKLGENSAEIAIEFCQAANLPLVRSVNAVLELEKQRLAL